MCSNGFLHHSDFESLHSTESLSGNLFQQGQQVTSHAPNVIPEIVSVVTRHLASRHLISSLPQTFALYQTSSRIASCLWHVKIINSVTNVVHTNFSYTNQIFQAAGGREQHPTFAETVPLLTDSYVVALTLFNIPDPAIIPNFEDQKFSTNMSRFMLCPMLTIPDYRCGSKSRDCS